MALLEDMRPMNFSTVCSTGPLNCQLIMVHISREESFLLETFCVNNFCIYIDMQIEFHVMCSMYYLIK